MLAFAVFTLATGLVLGDAVSDNDTCPVPYVSVGGKCLLFASTETLHFGEARSYCHQLQGELAKIDTMHLHKAVVDHITHEAGLKNHQFWIGAHDQGLTGDWRWLDGSEVTMGTPFWAPNCDCDGCQMPDNGGNGEPYASIEKKYSFYFNDIPNWKYSPICEFQQ